MASDQPHHNEPQSQPAKPSDSDAINADDGVLGLIGAVEQRLAELKEAREAERRDLDALAEQRADLERRELTLNEQSEALEQRAAELDQRQSQADQARREIEEARQQIESSQRDLEQQRERIQRERQELDEARGEREREIERRENALTQREQEATQRESTLDDRQRELNAEAARLAEQAEALKDHERALEQERSAFVDRASTRQAELDSRERAVQKQQSELERDREQVESLRRQTQEQAEQIRQQRESLEQEQQRLEQQRAEIEQAAHEVGQRDQRVQELEAELASTNETLQSLREQMDQAQRARSEAEQRAESLEQRLSEAQEKSSAGEQELSNLRAAVEKRDRAVEALKERVDQTEAERARLAEELESASQQSAAFPSGVDPHLRLQRLRRYREQLQQRWRKVAKARDALAEKQKECDRVLEQRFSLSQQKQELERREQAVAATDSRRRGLVALFLFVLASLGLGAVSWVVAGRMAPATYLVSATLRADAGQRSLDQEQQRAWSEYCRNLATDPRLMEVAAERMRRRGLLKLGLPADLADRVEADLDIAQPSPGELDFTLRGRGAERTELVLKTYLAAMVSMMNDSQQRRLDQASTVVASAPEPGAEPIEDQRLAYAAAGWAGSTALLLALSGLVWTRAARAREQLDEESRRIAAEPGS